MIGKLALIAKRGFYCESCIFQENYPAEIGLEVHHCLFHRKKGYSVLDEEYNLAVVCGFCHPYCNGHPFRVRFWKEQQKRYPVIELRAWISRVKDAGLVVEAWIEEGIQ